METMAIDNKCGSCRFKDMLAAGSEGHCYMFRTEPQTVCMQHPSRALPRAQVDRSKFTNLGQFAVVSAFADLMLEERLRSMIIRRRG